MNRDILNKLVKVANSLDDNNFYDEADKVTNIFTKMAQAAPPTPTPVTPGAETPSGPQAGDTDASQATPETQRISVMVNGKQIFAPDKLQSEITLNDDKGKPFIYILGYDTKIGKWVYSNNETKKSYPVDETGAMEPRPKRVNLFGIRWPRLNLPNLNNIIPIERTIRRDIVPKITAPVRKLVGDPLRPATRKITDTLDATVGNALGIKDPTKKTTEQTQLEDKIGKSDNRETTKPSGKLDADVIPATPAPPTPAPATPAAPVLPKVFNPQTLRDIKNANDLLFWSMSVANGINFGSYDKTKEREYYSPDKQQSTLTYINMLTSSPYVDRINSLIKTFKNDAIQKLNKKTEEASKPIPGSTPTPGSPNTVPTPTPGTPSTSVKTPAPPGSPIPTGATPPREANTLNSNNKIILASLNKICNNLESLGAFEEARTVNNIFFKLAQEEID